MSELQQTFHTIKKNRFFIAAFTLFVGAAGLLIANIAPAKVQTSVAFTIALTQKQATPDYQYDGYYAIKAAELVSQTLISWFLTPSVIVEIYDQAGIQPNISNLNRFVSRFKARQHAAQNIVVTFKEEDKGQAKKIAESMIKVMEKKGEALNTSTNNDALFTIRGSNPVLVPSRLNPILTTSASLFLGLLFSLFIVTVKQIWDEDRN